MKIFLSPLCVLAILYSATVQAALITVVTDQKSAVAANNIITLFKRTKPFSRMPDLEFKILVLKDPVCQIKTKSIDPAQDLPESCQSPEAIKATEKSLKRGPVCNNYEGLAKIKAETNSDHIIYVREDKAHGGTGGVFPVVNTGSPSPTAIHELLHNIGFADQYGFYTPCEADIKCTKTKAQVKIQENGFSSKPVFAVNMVIFEDQSPYSSDKDARRIHADQIPWYSQILKKTPITQNKLLGTPSQIQHIGLFEAPTCKLASNKKLKAWQPGSETTVMENIKINYIPEYYWEHIAQALHTKLSPVALSDEPEYQTYRDPTTQQWIEIYSSKKLRSSNSNNNKNSRKKENAR